MRLAKFHSNFKGLLVSTFLFFCLFKAVSGCRFLMQDLKYLGLAGVAEKLSMLPSRLPFD